MSTASTNGGESMQFIFGLVSYILILYGMEQRSVLTLLLAPLHSWVNAHHTFYIRLLVPVTLLSPAAPPG